MFAVLHDEVAFFAPELRIIITLGSGFSQQDKEITKIVHVNVIPVGLASTDDGGFLLLKSDFGKLVNLASTARDWTSTVPDLS
jgi:hypothetical protein